MPQKNNRLTITAQALPNVSIIFLFLSPFIIFFYASFIFNPANKGDTLLYILQIVADSISIMSLLGIWLTIFLDTFVLPHHRIHQPDKSTFFQSSPTVDILIPTAGEPLEIITETIKAALNVKYPHKTFVLDDAKSKAVEAFAIQVGATYITRPSKSFAKAGNLNHGLRFSKAEFFIILDADQVAEPSLIDDTLGYMADKQIAMVQTPQYITNRGNFISAGTAYAQDIFYKYLTPAKNISDSVFCVGTNVLFRRKAIDEIRGIAEISHSEDIWTSRFLHEKGWKTIYINKVLAKGRAPETINAYFRQQLRWAKGGFGMLFLHNPLSSSQLKIDQKIQYFLANSFYFVGFSILIYLLFPIFYLLFGLSPINTTSSMTWLVHYFPFMFLYYSLTWLLLGHLRLPLISIAVSSFWPYILAFFSIIFNTQENWTPTSSNTSQRQVIMHWIWPHVLLILLSVFALVVGWFEPTNFWNTLTNSLWAIWNLYLLITFLTTQIHVEEESSAYVK